MGRLHLGILFVVGVVVLSGGCSATPLGAQRQAQRAYEDCVELNGPNSCGRERATAERRREELNDRDLNKSRRSRALDPY